MRDHSSADVDVVFDDSGPPRRRAERRELQMADVSHVRADELQAASSRDSLDWRPAREGPGALSPLKPEGAYLLRARTVNEAGSSDWLYSSALLRVPPAPSMYSYSCHAAAFALL